MKQSVKIRMSFLIDKLMHVFQLMKQMYSRIMINEDGIEALRGSIASMPTVLLPSHRSYADFLLVSYISYHFSLPLPVIAAGQGNVLSSNF